MSKHQQQHGSLKTYLIGFVLSVILTAIPFVLIINKTINDSSIAGFVILMFAVLQVIVHMICFLHMNFTSEHGWNIMALIFTVILVIIMFSGSVWVMSHLNQNMMPVMTNMT